MADVGLVVNEEVVGLTVALCYLLKLAREKNLVTQQDVEAALMAAAEQAKKSAGDSRDGDARLRPIGVLRTINLTDNWNDVSWDLPR